MSSYYGAGHAALAHAEQVLENIAAKHADVQRAVEEIAQQQQQLRNALQEARNQLDARMQGHA